MPKATTVYGIVTFGGHLVRGMVRVVLTTEEPLTVLESDKLYYGKGVKARVTKTKTLTMSELTEKLKKEFSAHVTDVQHMYELNSNESVKILKKVFDVKTCKKLSFSKDMDNESEDDTESVGSIKEKEEPVTKSTKGKEEPVTKSTKGKSAVVKEEEPVTKSAKTKEKEEPTTKGKSAVVKEGEEEPTTKGKSAVVKEGEPVTKSTKGKSAVVKEEEPVTKSTKGKSAVVKEEVSMDKKKPDLTDSKKTTTSKVKESKVRIPLSDSDGDGSDDNCSDIDLDD